MTWRWSTSDPCRLSAGASSNLILYPLSIFSEVISSQFSYHCYTDDTQLILSFPPSDTHVSAPISAWLADLSSCMAAHHLKSNRTETELLYIPWRCIPTSPWGTLRSHCLTMQEILGYFWTTNYHSLLIVRIWLSHIDFSFATSQGCDHVSPQRPLRSLFSLLSSSDWTTATCSRQVFPWVPSHPDPKCSCELSHTLPSCVPSSCLYQI